jgi:hypothetical protein
MKKEKRFVANQKFHFSLQISYLHMTITLIYSLLKICYEYRVHGSNRYFSTGILGMFDMALLLSVDFNDIEKSARFPCQKVEETETITSESVIFYSHIIAWVIYERI